MIQKTTMKIAYAVSDAHEEHLRRGPIADEAALLGGALAARGAALTIASWRDPAVRWSTFDAVLPLACWDYIAAPGAFSSWLARLGAEGVRVVNTADLVRWSMDKAYLLDLRAAGVQVAPLLHFPAGSRPDLAAEIEARGWERFVLKPAISAGAHRTLASTSPVGAEVRALAGEILAGCGLLVQPFFDEISRDGEWSLLFFGGEHSHSVLKTPRPGDFRTQAVWGGSERPATAPPGLPAQAAAVLRAAPEPPTYARVDGLLRDGVLHLLELEVIEPYLFLHGAGREAVERLCTAVLAAVAR